MMVKLQGPGLAQDAAGPIAKTLIFAKNKGRPYAKLWRSPANPKSASQTALRTMHRFLSQIWDQLTPAQQATWTVPAKRANYANVNAFQSYNASRWRDFRSPTGAYPGTESAPTGLYNNPSAVAVSRGVRVGVGFSVLNDTWAVIYHLVNGAGNPTTWANLVGIIPNPTLAPNYFTHRPLDPGTYYYRFRHFTHDGVLGYESFGTYSATVT